MTDQYLWLCFWGCQARLLRLRPNILMVLDGWRTWLGVIILQKGGLPVLLHKITILISTVVTISVTGESRVAEELQ